MYLQLPKPWKQEKDKVSTRPSTRTTAFHATVKRSCLTTVLVLSLLSCKETSSQYEEYISLKTPDSIRSNEGKSPCVTSSNLKK